MAAWRTLIEFVHEASWEQIPADVQHIAVRSALDLCGTSVAGSRTELSRIARQLAFSTFGGDQATLLLDGRRAGAAGAALANGMTIDAVDAHDGHRLAKGHAGAGVFPVALAAGERFDWDGRSFLTALVIGYEVALLAGESLHQQSSSYHSSGAWVAIGAAAVEARARALDPEATQHALGIAEYHGPRSEMMRCIDHPTMLKDGSGWGALTGVLAAELAAAGFTGAPATSLEHPSAASPWSDAGSEWRMRNLYFKPYPCCRWAHPAIDAAMALCAEHGLQAAEISEILVHTFEEASRLQVRKPLNTEQAQYSLPFPLAAALVFGRLTPDHVQPPYLQEPAVLRLAEAVRLQVDSELDARFPAQALARVRLTTSDGRKFDSAVTSATGGVENPLTDAQLAEKFQLAMSGSLQADRAGALEQACWSCADLKQIGELVVLLADPIGKPLPQ